MPNQQQPTSPKHYRLAKWKHTSIDKMFIFLAVNIFMGRNKKIEIQDYYYYSYINIYLAKLMSIEIDILYFYG